MRGRRDWQTEQKRYIVSCDGAGTGPRAFDHELEVGEEVRDLERRCAVERVEQPRRSGRSDERE